MAKIRACDEWTSAEKDAAKAILLEKSPYGVDGAEYIGVDPRRIPARLLVDAGVAASPSLLDVIRAKCLDCCGEQADEVRKCVSFKCPNWPYRMGTNPFHKRTVTDEEREKMRARARAMTARKQRGDHAS